MIRPAHIKDLPDLLLLAQAMHRESPSYRGWQYDGQKVSGLLEGLIAGRGCLLVSELDGLVVGGIAGFCVEHWFSSEKVASDLALFIDREHRNGSTAMRLIRGFVFWAERMGARRVTLGITTGIHPDSTARLYLAAGLEENGRVFSKELH